MRHLLKKIILFISLISLSCNQIPSSKLWVSLLSLLNPSAAQSQQDCTNTPTENACMPSSGLLIRRTVTDTAGVTIKNSTVTFYPDGSTTLIARTKTDSIGNFDVTLPQGNYSYKITNYVSCNSPGTGSLAVVTGSDVGRPVIAIAAGCPYPRDFILPETITTLNGSSPTARTITLNWTAVNEDTGTGTASAYYIGYSTSPITSTSLCGAATSYVNSVVPKAAGGAETVTLSSSNGLFAPATTYYFCVQAVDESNNKGAWTNTVSVTTIADTVAPGTISLTATQGGPTSINLSWNTVANDGLTATSGSASSYEIRSAANIIFANNSGCGAATLVSNSLVPKALNGAETFTVSGLNNNTDYSICIRAVDQNANGGIWAYASAKTGLNPNDTTPPGSITTLTTTALSTTSIRLNWTSVSNDGTNAVSGAASSYDVRRSLTTFTGDSGCSSATPITNSVTPGVQGTAETFTDTGLTQGTTYYYCVPARDAVNNMGTWSGLAISGTTQSPRISVSQKWAGTIITGSGSFSNYIFQNIPSGKTSAAATFSITNIGNSSLSITSISLSSGDSSQFTTSQAVSNNVMPLASTTFTVTFSPVSSGTKSAVLSIVTNDNITPTFSFTVNGGAIAGTSSKFNLSESNTIYIPGEIYYFGSAASNSNIFRTFTIQNFGNANLVVSQVRFDSNSCLVFAISTALSTSTIIPGGNATFTVRARPDMFCSPNPNGAILEILTDDANAGWFGYVTIPVRVNWL